MTPQVSLSVATPTASIPSPPSPTGEHLDAGGVWVSHAPFTPAAPLPPASPMPSHRHAVLPKCYKGYLNGCYWFVLVCKLYFTEFPEMTSPRRCLSSFSVSRGGFITGLWPFRWRQVTTQFLLHFQTVFDHQPRGKPPAAMKGKT